MQPRLRKQKHRGAEATLAAGSGREYRYSRSRYREYPRLVSPEDPSEDPSEDPQPSTVSFSITSPAISAGSARVCLSEKCIVYHVRIARDSVPGEEEEVAAVVRRHGDERRRRASALIVSWSPAGVTRAPCMRLPSRETGRRSRVNLREESRTAARRRSGMPGTFCRDTFSSCVAAAIIAARLTGNESVRVSRPLRLIM